MRRAAVLAACAVTAAAAQATDDGGGFTCLACASEESLTAWYVAVSGTEYTCDPATYPIYVNKDGVPTTAHVFKHPACSYEYGTRAGATGGAISWVTQWCADDGTIWEASDCACEAAGGGACAAPGWDDDGYDDDGAPCDYDPGSCVDDRTTTDAFGDDCAWYTCNQGECGDYDDGDFAARDQCCACGGGTLAPSSYDDDTKKPSASDDGGDGCVLHVAGPVVTSPSNQVATVDSLQNYELAFTMELASDWTPSLGTGHWPSILRIGNLDYQRLPGIWFHETQNALYVMQSYSGCVGSPWSNNICEWGVTTTGVTFTAGVTYEIRVVVESNQMTVYVDGVSVGTASGPAVDTVTDAAVYVGDPWWDWDTAKVTLSDVTLSDAALAGACDAKKSSDGGGLWVTADVGTYDEMQAACEQGGGHLVVPASEDERLAAVAAVQASIHGDVAFWVGYTLAAYDSPGEEASYAGEGGSTMAEVGYWAWGGPDSGATCGKCGAAKDYDRCVHHTASTMEPPGYMMATCGDREQLLLVPGVCQLAKKSSSTDGGSGWALWVTAGTGSYEEMQAACEQGGGHLVVPASEDERLAALAAVQASAHGDVEIWVGYTLPSGSGPGTMANYDGENGLTMEEVGYYLWDSNCGKCGTSKSWDRCVHHTTVATGGGTPGYYMATCSGPRPGVCQPAGLWAGSLAPGYTHFPMTCVNHHNIELHAGKTVAECAAICDANALCLAFEYGVDYGGDGEYEAGDCQEQSSAEVTDCDGASYNLDLYVKDQPAAGSLAPGYTHFPMTCVNHHNIELHAGKTVAECAAICDANALCLAFEYGVDYGGDGEYEARDCQEQSSVVLNGCDGAHHNLDLFVKDQSSSSLDDATIREAVAAWLADAAVAEAAYGHISTWKTGGVTDMANLFCAHETNGDCAWQWNDHAVPRTAAASFNEDISAWDTSGVTTMARMFHVASSFNQPLGGWQVDKVTNMNFMFGEASAFNQDIGDWALDSVTYMQWMFADASAFDQDLGWCLYEVNFGYAFSGTLCQPTSCGVSSCAPTSAPTDFDGKFYDSNIRTAVAAWLSNSASAEATYGPISTWDTSGVTDMARLFCASETDGNCASSSSGLAAAAASFNEDISAWDTSGVTTMIRMFYEASSFNRDIGNWAAHNVVIMKGMFSKASAFNQDIGDWAVGSVTDMRYMFSEASAFDQDLGWCVADDVDLYLAFDNAPCEATACGVTQGTCKPTPAPTAFDGKFYDSNIRTAVVAWASDATAAEATYGPISTWDTSGVTDMEGLFCAVDLDDDGWSQCMGSAAASFNEDISAWDTSGVTMMARMFYKALSFNQPLSGWQVDKVTNMNFMFSEASAFNQDIGDWALDSVTYMQSMFEGASAFDQDLGWCVGDEVNLGDAFSGTLCQSTSCGVAVCAPTPAPSPGAAPDHPHWRWGAAGQSCDQACASTSLTCNAQPMATVTTLARFQALAGAINSPTTPDGITGVGGHTAPDQAPFSDIGSGNGGWPHLAFLSTGTPTCAGAHSNRARLCYCGVFDDTSIETARDAWLADATAAEAAYGHIATWGTGGVTHMGFLFCASSAVGDCNAAAATFDEDISAWDTSSVTNMRYMFKDASAFDQPVGAWRVDKVTHMGEMFYGAASFDQPLGDWQVDQVTDMRWMFADAAAFNRPLGDWSVDNVGDFRFMFEGATSFNQPLSGWSVAKVTNMRGMFQGAASFDQDLGAWSVGGVTNMQLIFNGASAFDQDLGWCVDTSVTTNNAFAGSACAATACGVSAPNEDGICPVVLTDATIKTAVAAWLADQSAADATYGPIEKWDTSQVTDMAGLFCRDCGVASQHFNADIRDWDTSAVTSMRQTFKGAASFGQPVGGWDVSKVTDMYETFRGATSFNTPLNDWDVAQVTTFYHTFAWATSFNMPLNKWAMGSATTIDGMFRNTNYNQNLGWCLEIDIYSMEVFKNAACSLTACGVEQGYDEGGRCKPLVTPAPSPAPTPRPTLAPTKCSVRTPPQVLEATFSPGVEVMIKFDAPTDMFNLNVEETFQCHEVLNFNDNDRDSTPMDCSFISSTAVLIAAKDEVNRAGWTVALQPCVVGLEDAKAWDCDCASTEDDMKVVTIEVPDDLQKPEARLEGPQQAATCEILKIDASPSIGGLGSAFTSYAWAAAAPDASADAQQELADELARASVKNFHTVNFPTGLLGMLGGGTRVDVTVTVTDWMGYADTSDVFSVELLAGAPPTVSIPGDPTRTLTRADALGVEAVAIATGCDGRPDVDRGVEYAWALSTTEGAATGLASASRSPKKFSLDPYALAVGNYTLAVTATDAGDAGSGANATASTAIIVEAGPLVAEVVGGEAQVAVAGDTVRLDASPSYDTDVEGVTGAAAGLEFRWSFNETVLAGEVVDLALVGDAGCENEEGCELVVTLTVTKDRRAATAAVVLELLVPEEVVVLPKVDVDASAHASRRVSAQGTVKLLGTVSSDGADGVLASTWVVDGALVVSEGCDDLACWANTGVEEGGGGEYRHDLVVAPGALVGGATYGFRLLAAFTGADVSVYAGVTLAAVTPPAAGQCAVAPQDPGVSSYVALSTKFVVSTSSWVAAAEDYPLEYSFQATAHGVTTTLAVFGDKTTVADVYLSAGDVTVVAMARDALGGVGEASAPDIIAVAETALAGEALEEKTEELLDEAFALDRTEQVLQVAVAVSEADVETTAATTEILVDAVAAVVETLDADESSVEAAAVAAEVTSSTHLTAAAANTSLNSVGQLAALSTEVGITGVAADGLVGTLSNVLSVENLPPNATAALGESIDAIGAALVYDAVPGEKWRGVEKEHVALGAQSVKANATNASLAAPGTNSSVALQTTRNIEVVVAELARDPLSGDFEATSRIVRFGAFANIDGGRRRLSSGPVFTASISIDAGNSSEVARAFDEGQVLHTNLTCPCHFVGLINATCPDGRNVSLSCDGRPQTVAAACEAGTTQCTTSENGQWVYDDSCRATQFEKRTLCTCETSQDDAKYYSTATAARTLISVYSAHLTDPPDFRKAKWVLTTLLVLFGCCVLMTCYGRRLDARDKREHEFSRSLDSLFDGLDSRLGGKGVGRFDDLARPWKSRAATGLRVQHPFVNYYCIYSKTIPRGWRAWVCGFEVLAFLFVLAVQTNLEYPESAKDACGARDIEEDCLQLKNVFRFRVTANLNRGLEFSPKNMCAWDQCSQSCFAVEPGDGATFDPSHLLLILAVFWCTIPFIRICLVLFENYLVAPVPYALQCCRSGTRSARWTTCMSPEGAPSVPDAEKGLAVDDDDFLTALDDVDAEWDNDEDDEWGNDDDDVATLMNVVTKADIEVARAPILRRSLSQHDRDVLREEQRTWAEGVARDLRQANLGVISPEDLAKISVPAGMKAVLKSDVLAALSFGTDEIDRATAKILGEPVADAVVMRAAELAARAREAKQLDVKGAADAATVLQSLSRSLLRDWQYTPTRKVFVQRVEARVAKHLARARVWNEKLQCGPRRKTARFDAMVRREHLRRTRFHVAAEASKRMNEKLEAPLRPPRVWQYLGAWFFVLGTHAFFAYYLITTGAQFGLQKSKVWLIESFFATVTMFLIVKPLFVVFYYLMVPSLLEENIAEAAEARKRGRRARALPFATELPTGATYYVLKRRPELADTPAGKIVASEQEASRGAHDAEAFVRSLGEAAPGRLTSLVGHLLVCLVGTFLLLHEEVQETMLEELVAALPVFASGVLGLIPTSLMERDDGVGEMMSLIVVAIWVLIAYGLFLLMRNIYHVFLEAIDPEQKAHASLRRRGPKILARLKRAASRIRRPKASQEEPDLAATAEAARNQLALVPIKAAPVSVDRPLVELSPEGVAAWLFLQELPGDPADVDALGERVRERAITGAEFSRLDADALKTMGVATLGLRKAILRRVREDAAAQRAAAQALVRVGASRGAVVTSESSASRAVASAEPGRQLVTRDALAPRAEDAEVDAYAEAVKKRRAALRAIFDRVDYNHDGQVSRIEAIKALRKDDEFARMLGFEHHTRVRQEDGTRDKLMLAFGALDENEDKMLSFEEFRHASLVALSSVVQPPPASGMALGAPAGEAKTAEPPTPPLQIGSSEEVKTAAKL